MSPEQIALLKKWGAVLQKCKDVDPVFHIAMATEFDQAYCDAKDAARVSLQEVVCMSLCSRQIGRIRDKYKFKPSPPTEAGARKLIL